MELERHSSIDSTNLRARRFIEESHGDVGARLIVAGEQTAGRGRLGRTWLSPRGGLWCSLVWPVGDGVQMHELGLRAGVGAVRAVNDLLEAEGETQRAQLKWPNDVLIEGRKAAGILIETVSSGGAWVAIVGVGVNVNNDVSAAGLSFRRTPTSLGEITGRALELERVENALVRRMCECLSVGTAWAEIVASAQRDLFGIGLEVECAENNRIVRGVLAGLSDEGLPIVVDRGGVRMIAGAGADLRIGDSGEAG